MSDQSDEIQRQNEEGYPGQPANKTRVLQMNESTSDNWDMVPFPARQQMGDHGDLKDARSGNGVSDENQTGFTEGGHTTMPVTYHLESTPPPSEPAGAPGSDSYNRSARGSEGMASEKETSFGALRHDTAGPVSTQHEEPGRDDRITQRNASSVASSDGTSSAPASDSTQTADAPASENADVPNASVQDVMTWVNGDKTRARAALDAENARPTPRATLVAQLQELL